MNVGRPIDHKNTLLGVFSFGMPSLHLFTFIIFFIILYNMCVGGLRKHAVPFLVLRAHIEGFQYLSLLL